MTLAGVNVPPAAIAFLVALYCTAGAAVSVGTQWFATVFFRRPLPAPAVLLAAAAWPLVPVLALAVLFWGAVRVGQK